MSNSLANDWAEQDVSSAMAYIDSMSTGPSQNRLIDAVSRQLGQTDPAKAIQLPDGDGKNHALNGVLGQL